MNDLTEFLLARIAEDEAFAREAMGDTDGKWSSWNRSHDTAARRDLAAGGERIAVMPATIDEHVCRHDPARVLAECDAKRRIAQEHEEGIDCPCVSECFGIDAPCRTLRLLALPYADHPDYREEWRP